MFSKMIGLRLKVEKRVTFPRSLTYLLPFLAIVAALLVGSTLLLIIRVSPLKAYSEMFSSAFGGTFFLAETLVKAIPLMLCGLGVSLAFKVGFWNIGAEGQLQLGALGATFIALTFSDFSAAVLIPLMVLVGFLSGGGWGLIAAFLKAKMGADEIVTTLMLNFIGIFLVSYFIYWPWRDPLAFGHPRTPLFAEAASMPRLIGRLHATIFLAIALAIMLYILVQRTKLGFEIRVVGENPSAAKYAGINTFKILMLVMFISGGMAGIAGMGEVSGVHQTLLRGFSPGYGYTAIVVAWLARRNLIAVLPVAFFLGALFNGGYGMQLSLGVPIAIVHVIQALILFFVLGFEILSQYKIAIRRGG